MTTAVEWADRSNAPGCARVINAAVSDEGEQSSGLAAALRARRHRQSQAAAAAEIGVAQSTYAKWERGGIPRSHLDKIARWLAVSDVELDRLIAAQARLNDGHVDDLAAAVARLAGEVRALTADVADLRAEVADLRAERRHQRR